MVVETGRAEKLPPHDIEAEEAIIASLLVDPEAIYRVAPTLKPEDFFREKNAWAFEACLALWERNESINQITVSHELARRGRLEEVGGAAYLSRLVTELPTSVGVEHYAGLVQRDSSYRRLISAAGQIAQMAYHAGPDVGDVLARAEPHDRELQVITGVEHRAERVVLERCALDIADPSEHRDSHLASTLVHPGPWIARPMSAYRVARAAPPSLRGASPSPASGPASSPPSPCGVAP